MNAFNSDFKRDAKLEQNKREMELSYWTREYRWGAVSAKMAEMGDQIESPDKQPLPKEVKQSDHPENNDEFKTLRKGRNNDIKQYKPTTDNWVLETIDIKFAPIILDKYAYEEFLSTFNSLNFNNVRHLGRFLQDQFTVTYYYDNSHSNKTGKYDQCETCEGTGIVIEEESVENYERMQTSQRVCEDCDGEGEIFKESFTRTFPFTQGKKQIMETSPTANQYRAIEFAIERLSDHQNTIHPQQILMLFDAIEYHSNDKLVDRIIHYLKPTLPTVTEEVITPEDNSSTDHEAHDSNALSEFHEELDDISNEVMNPDANDTIEEPDPNAVAELRNRVNNILAGTRETITVANRSPNDDSKTDSTTSENPTVTINNSDDESNQSTNNQNDEPSQSMPLESTDENESEQNEQNSKLTIK